MILKVVAKRVGLAVILAAGTGVSLWYPAAAPALVLHDEVPAVSSVDHSDFDTILKATVRDGRVDYLLIRKSYWPLLTGYLDRMGDVDWKQLSRDEQLALFCNLYNATMIRTIVERYHAAYSPAENNKQIFRDSLVRVKGRTITLNELEHQLIRAGFNEPRIHAALVCAGLGCPSHPDHAYTGKGLSQVLDADMAKWVADPTRNLVNEAEGTVVLSKLFKSYADDFGGIDKVVAAVDAYHPADFTKLKVTFSDKYDWTLNIAAPAGKWVKITKPDAEVRENPDSTGKPQRPAVKDAVFEVLSQQGEWIQIDRPFGAGPAWVRQANTGEFTVAVPPPQNF